MSALPLRKAFKTRKDKLLLWLCILLFLLDKLEPTEGLILYKVERNCWYVSCTLWLKTDRTGKAQMSDSYIIQIVQNI